MSKYVVSFNPVNTTVIADSSHTINDTLFVDCLIKAVKVSNASTSVLTINIPNAKVGDAQLGFFDVSTDFAPSNSAAIKMVEGVPTITLAAATVATKTYNVQGWVKLK